VQEGCLLLYPSLFIDNVFTLKKEQFRSFVFLFVKYSIKHFHDLMMCPWILFCCTSYYPGFRLFYNPQCRFFRKFETEICLGLVFHFICNYTIQQEIFPQFSIAIELNWISGKHIITSRVVISIKS
jgi:hypothetical protein